MNSFVRNASVLALLASIGCYTAEPQQQAQVPIAEQLDAAVPEVVAVADIDTTGDQAVDIKLPPEGEAVPLTAAPKPEAQTATFASGCFWCTEAVFEMLEGVTEVESGYCNGQVPNPTYKEVCEGTTGHAEAIRMRFDPSVITYEELLAVFFKSHDPTTLNRQGADVGTQYRSGIYFHNEEQQQQAQAYIAKLDKSGEFFRPIVTEVVAAEEFYPAEDRHQDYFELNGRAPYCARVIQPKVDKVRATFADKLRD